MFAGHYAAAFAAKAVEPRAPLWTLIAGAQLVDIGWAALVMTGIEHGRIDPTLPGSALVLEHMPFTHSLPAAIAWSLAAALLARYALRLVWPAAIAIAAVVFSHWLLDLIVHRPDLELYPQGPKLGFALWDLEVAEQAVEIGLIAIAGIFWSAQRTRAGQKAWPAAAFIGLLVAVQIIALLMPAEASNNLAESGAMALPTYLVLAIVAIFLDGKAAPRANSPQA
ncbi:MAG: hypothetical protein EOP61_24280 [Sphingomonadales bacterium]|nr:MAG: hypothetical protein EOP61_24280 [Sphingomonadales bacterium]